MLTNNLIKNVCNQYEELLINNTKDKLASLESTLVKNSDPVSDPAPTDEDEVCRAISVAKKIFHFHKLLAIFR